MLRRANYHSIGEQKLGAFPLLRVIGLWLVLLAPVFASGFVAIQSACRRPIEYTRCHATPSQVGNRDQNKKKGTGRTGPKQQDLDALVTNIGLSPVGGNKKQKGTQKQILKASGGQSSKKKLTFIQSSAIDLQTQLDYSRNGHAALRACLNPKALSVIRKDLMEHATDEELKAWRQKVQVASNSEKLAASCRTVEDCREQLELLGITASLPFLQYFNTWRSIPEVKDLAFSLGQAASILLDVPNVRLYQDSVFWKRTDDGPTPWHADARMAPFDTTNMITFWIPLQDIPSDGTALMFCSESHSDFALPYWNPVDQEGEEDSEWNRLEKRYPKKTVDYMPMAMGDVTVHSGWTLHCANENFGTEDRMALALSYVDAQAELRPDALDNFGQGDNEDRWSYQDWAHSVKPRKKFRHELVPIVWPQSER